jgi:hypothetical protein
VPELRANIAHIPRPYTMQALPLDHRGFPVPWFVHVDDLGAPDFRMIGRGKIEAATRNRLCWICGRPMGRMMAFVVGPMCAIEAISSEPPSHPECATYAARACPFLAQPKMRRNAKGLPDEREPPGGIMITRNPGVALVWWCLRYDYEPDGKGEGGMLFIMGPHERLFWYCEGREASHAEVLDSFESGLPLLMATAGELSEEHVAALAIRTRAALKLLPPAD